MSSRYRGARRCEARRIDVRINFRRCELQRGSRVQERPTQRQRVRALGMDPVHRLSTALYGIQPPKWGHHRPVGRGGFSSRLCGFSRSLCWYSQGLSRPCTDWPSGNGATTPRVGPTSCANRGFPLSRKRRMGEPRRAVAARERNRPDGLGISPQQTRS